jgi:hypothetical protein
VNIVLSIAPIALLAALIAVPIYYLTYRYAPDPKKEVSLVRYVLLALAVGAGAYVIGTIVGIAAACSSTSAGNLCGLVGVFGAGPLLAAVAIFVYAHLWAKNARRAP